MTDKKAEYTKTTEELDLEERMADDYVSPKVLVEGEVPGQLQEGGFVNVDPIYQNYANDQDAPRHAEEGVYADLENKMFGEELAEKARKGNVKAGDVEEDEDKDKTSGSTESKDSTSSSSSSTKTETSKTGTSSASKTK